MYLVEFIIKKIRNLKRKNKAVYNPVQEEDRNNDCESHVYLPIDSTKEVLACKNCGHIIKSPKA